MSTVRVRHRLTQRMRASIGTAGLPKLERRLFDLAKEMRYEAVAKLSDRYARWAAAPPSDLRLSEMRVYSQSGEDGVICALINLLEVSSEYFVEFGVEDGTECNTRFLAEVLGWGGAYFEVDSTLCGRLQRRYENTDRVVARNVAVTVGNIGKLFGDCGVPRDFGILSIDVDGQDVWLWDALPAEYRPAIVVIEYNSGLDRDECVAEPLGVEPKFTSAFGASLGAIDVVAKEKGYRLAHTEIGGNNAFYVRDDLAEAAGHIRGVVDRSPNYHGSGAGHPSDRSGRGLVDIRSRHA